MKALNSLLKDVKTLPSPPSIAIKIIQEVKRGQSSIRELVNIISFDPALTAKILKVANSSFYSLPDKVDSVERAVNILGLEGLKNIALSFVLVKGLKRKSVDEFNHEFFWKRSITAAVSAELIASKLKMKQEDTFVTTLLMDIGILVMYLSRPDDYIRIFKEKKISNVTTLEAERSLFGFDHQEVGSEILKEWGIPENIYMPIAYHHKQQECPAELNNIVDVLLISDISSSVYHSSKRIEKLGELRNLLQNRLDITEDEASEFIDSVAEKTVEILSTFEIDASDIKPYSLILEEANEELGKLNLSYEQLVMELKLAKKKAMDLAKEAWEANEKLKEIAIKDGLTNIYNHRYFQELLDKELTRAERYSRTLSLILIDIDHFKKINDTFGHHQGDEVLRSVAEIFEQAVRRPDIAARYGGEEFAVVLPETDIQGAVVLAERIRQEVEKMEIKLNDQSIKVTISLGITTYNPSIDRKTKKDLIEAADNALYKSKKTGRNRISIISLHGSN